MPVQKHDQHINHVNDTVSVDIPRCSFAGAPKVTDDYQEIVDIDVAVRIAPPVTTGW